MTESTFGFNFEKWYSDGFWQEKYIPHSMVHNEKVIANVSINIMNFNMDGIEKHYIQLGTVMTDKEYRGQGLSRYLIDKIIDEYKDKTDGIYLFANDSVSNDRFTMDNPDLIAFWVTGWRSDSVYYLHEEDTYVNAEVKENNVFIHQIIASHNKVNLDNVISSFGSGIKKVTLGFTPYVTNGYKAEELLEEDCTLFILGKDLQNIKNKKLMFPTLSHA